jgi:hypothetical protein
MSWRKHRSRCRNNTNNNMNHNDWVCSEKDSLLLLSSTSSYHDMDDETMEMESSTMKRYHCNKESHPSQRSFSRYFLLFRFIVFIVLICMSIVSYHDGFLSSSSNSSFVLFLQPFENQRRSNRISRSSSRPRNRNHFMDASVRIIRTILYADSSL